MNCLVLFEILPMRFLFQKHQSCQSRLTMKVSLLLGGVGQDLGFKVGPCVLMEDGQHIDSRLRAKKLNRPQPLKSQSTLQFITFVIGKSHFSVVHLVLVVELTISLCYHHLDFKLVQVIYVLKVAFAKVQIILTLRVQGLQFLKMLR